MAHSMVALITGASSGIGLSVARRLCRSGYQVYGTSRIPCSNNASEFEMIALDVTSDDSVRNAVDRVITAAGRIDLLVNNAGVLQASLIEETSLEDARVILETNFFGVVRMTQAVLPSMRKYHYGRIITVGSLAGLVGIPGEGFYAASKFALEGFNEALRHEVEPFGIKVSIIEPGFFKTNLCKAMVSGKRKIPDYDRLRNAIVSTTKNAVLEGGDPEKVAALIVRVASAKKPVLRYRVGLDALWVPRLKRFLPQLIFMVIINKWVKYTGGETRSF